MNDKQLVVFKLHLFFNIVYAFLVQNQTINDLHKMISYCCAWFIRLHIKFIAAYSERMTDIAYHFLAAHL